MNVVCSGKYFTVMSTVSSPNYCATLQSGVNGVPEVRKSPSQIYKLQLDAGRILQTDNLSEATEHHMEPRSLAATLKYRSTTDQTEKYYQDTKVYKTKQKCVFTLFLIFLRILSKIS